jgi:hypothetical protein
MTPSELRHAWLEQAARSLRPLFTSEGFTVPEQVRISIGWPKGARKAIGQCWSVTASKDGHFEIFISPALDDGPQIYGTLAHEMVHATVGLAAGHKAPFKKCALAIGLQGKMKATENGPKMQEAALAFIAEAGAYPAGALIKGENSGPKKQGTRMVKCECAECGYTVRTTRKWLDVGAPLCPCNSEPMREV